jgi:hypothetical protein
VDGAAVVDAFGIGAALLGFWATARFPGLGPQAVVPALLTTAAVLVLELPLPAAAERAVDAGGPPFALLAVVLPALTLLFWACGCLVRSLVALLAPYRR